MPVDPHTWVDISDFLTATILNGDMYRWNGEEFYSTGIRFHARKPIYASCNGTATASNIGNNAWNPAYDASGGSQGTSLIRADTGSLMGAWWDPNITGNIRMSSLNAGGGLPLVQGGVGLMFGHVAWGPNGGAVGAGLGLSSGSSGAGNPGTLQAANSARNMVTFVCDILDGNSQRWTIFAYNNTGGTAAPLTSPLADGSGRCSRLHAQWASVYPANGFTVLSGANPATGWTNSSVLNAALLNSNTGIRNVLRQMNMPPLLRAPQTSTQGLTANTNTTVTLGSPTYDTYSGLSGNTYTVPFSGVYLVHGYVGCQNFSGNLRAGVKINGGTTYWGPDSPMASGNHGTATKTQLLSLVAGDTITLQALATAAATTSSIWAPRLLVYQICQRTIVVPSVTLPDTTYRWAAGTPGPISTLFNQHVANDLVFLMTQRPYALTYQNTAQTGIAMNTPTTVVMQSNTGIVHGENTDRWNAFNTTTGVFTAPVNGWYLAVWEVFLAAPTLTATPVVIATIQPTPSGLAGWDQYQEQNMATTSSPVPGATGMAYYYLRAGDTITPGVQTQDSSATTIATQVGTGINSSFGIVWVGE